MYFFSTCTTSDWFQVESNHGLLLNNWNKLFEVCYFGLYLQGLNVKFEESSIQLPSEAFRSRDSHVVSVIYLTLNDVISLRKGKSENTSILPNTTVVSSTVYPPPQKNFMEPVKIVLQNKRVSIALISKTATRLALSLRSSPYLDIS